jgi:hypothetical protein
MMSEKVFEYDGKIYVRPLGRGICLVDENGNLSDGQLEDDYLPEGYLHAQIVVTRLSEDENEKLHKL